MGAVRLISKKLSVFKNILEVDILEVDILEVVI
jgi:hypothetical protein